MLLFSLVTRERESDHYWIFILKVRHHIAQQSENPYRQSIDLCRYIVVRSACYNKWNRTVFVVWHSRSYDLGLRIHIRNLDSVRQVSELNTPKNRYDDTIVQGLMSENSSGTDLNGLIVPYPGFVEFEGTIMLF